MENEAQGNDYALKFLADMEAKHAALGNAIASVRAALNVGALGGLGVTDVSAPGIPPTPFSSGKALPRGAFLGKSVAEAIKLYLDAIRARKNNREIAQALKEGGAITKGNLEARVTGTLFQLKNRGEVLRFDDGWGLAEWYPESFRNRITQEPKSRKKKKPVKVNKQSAQKETSSWKPTNDKIGKMEQIEKVLSNHPSDEFRADLVAQRVGIENVHVAEMLLGRLVSKGRAEKTPSGNYRAAADAKLRELPKAV